jgi:6-phosphogluconolactonase (cycloisomerase 2 family)
MLNGMPGAIAHYDLAGGILTPSGAPVATGKAPLSIDESPDGRSVYVVNEISATISQYDVGAGGALTPKSPPTVPAGSLPFGMAISPDGRSAYVIDEGSTPNVVLQYDVAGDGSLSPKTPPSLPALLGADQVVVSPDGHHVYVTDIGADAVSEYDVGPGGVLAAMSPPSVVTGTHPDGIAITPDGRHVYVTDSGATTLSEYNVGADGSLTPMSAPSVPTGRGTGFIVVSPDGAHAYATAQEDSDVWGYDILPSGHLVVQPGSPYATGPDPLQVVAAPDGTALFTSDFNGGDISQFGIGGGGLLAAATPPDVTIAHPGGIVIAPHQGPVAAFTVNGATAGAATGFDGAASSDPDGSVTRYDWSFGDGSSASSTAPTTTHAYAPGTYTATLTVTDDAGCSHTVFNGVTAFCNAPAASASRTFTIAKAASGAPPPVVRTGSASHVKRTAVTFQGTVDPAGAAVSDCYFEYGTSRRYGAIARCTQRIGPGRASAATVSAVARPLKTATTYHFRLVASTAGGTVKGADRKVRTLRPCRPAAPHASSASARSLQRAPLRTSRSRARCRPSRA